MTRNLGPFLAALLPLTAPASGATTDASAALVADRTTIERVYYVHRLGSKPPFEQALPPATIEHLVSLDLKKETLLKNAYGLEPKREWIETEVRRIDAESRAPEILREIRAALGDDPARFARSVARPIVVDRELRRRFDNDDSLHAQPRQQAGAAREKVMALALCPEPASWPAILQALKETGVGTVTDVTWQFGARPETRKADPQTDAPVVSPIPINARSRKYSIEATAQFTAEVDSENSRSSADHELYFDDLSGELKEVLRAQLRNRGDISAVIETPAAFLLFVARERTATSLTAAMLSVPKRSLEQWLAEQKD